MQVESFIIEVLKTTEAEIKLGYNKLFWQNNQWVVLGKNKGASANYKALLYEGDDELEAVTALKNAGHNEGEQW